MLQLFPFHCSTSVTFPAFVLDNPTATQNDALTHEMLLSWLESDRFGLDTICHDEPFHRSIRVACLSAGPWPPTAKQLVEEVHATPASEPFVTAGEATFTQRVPLYCAMKGLVFDRPTAKQKFGPLHVTAFR